MAETILDHRVLKELQPSYGLLRHYRPGAARYRFTAKNVSEAKRWQRVSRKALGETVGFQDLRPSPLSPMRVEEVDKGDYKREKILIRTSRDSAMPVYLLLPKGKKRPLPVVLAFHGHGYGVKDIVGLWQDGEERDTPGGYQKDFAVSLCRRGFAVAASEISCFGERQTDFSYLNAVIGQVAPTTCTHAAMLAFHLGGSVVGLRVFEGKRLVDYLGTRSDLDITRLGAMGISGGGMHTFFSTCLDERIKACVISGYYATFREGVLAMSHCACNFMPGLHKFGEIYDLGGLIAPRPLLVEAGDYDPIFPIRSVKKSIARTRKIYKLFGAERGLETDYFEGNHQISGRRAYDFLMEKI